MSSTLEQTHIPVGKGEESLLMTLQRVSKGLAYAHSSLDMATLVIQEGVKALGSAQGTMHMLSFKEDALELLFSTGYSNQEVLELTRISLEQDSPLTDLIRNRQPLFLDAEGLHCYTSNPVARSAALALVPLAIRDRLIGSFCLGFTSPHTFQAEERSFLLSLAELGSQTLERIQLQGAEQNLRLDHETGMAHLQTLLTSHPLGMALLDSTLRYQQINEPLARLNGLSVAAHIGHTPSEVLDDRGQLIEAHIRAVLTTGKPIHNLEVSRKTKSGNMQHFLLNYYPVRNTSDVILGVGCTVNDITENKCAEERLKESEAYFRALAETLPGFVWMDSSGGVNEYMNQRWTEFTGQSVEEARNEGWKAVTHPDDIPRIEAQWQRCRKTGLPFEIELRHRHKHGHYAWFLSKGLPLRNDQGEVMHWVGASIDITARKQAEAYVQVSEARFRELTNVVPEIILRCDPQGYLEFINQRWSHYTGMSEAETFELGVWPAIHPEDVAADRENYERCIASGDIYHGEYRLRRHDGVYRWHLERGIPMRDQQGRIIHWFHSITDMHDQKQIEQRVRDSEERFRLAADAGNTLIYEANSLAGSMVIVYGFERVLGLSEISDDLTFDWWQSRIHPEDLRGYQEELSRQLAQGGSQVAEYRLKHQKGHWLHIQDNRLLVQSADTFRLIGAVTDITARKEAEQKLKDSEIFNRAVLESSPDCVKLLDLSGRLSYMNANGLELMEIDDFETLRARTWVSLWPRATRPTIHSAIASARAGATGHFQEMCFTAKGKPKWWDIMVTAVPGADGKAVCLLGVSRDITGLKKTETELRESRERYQSLVKASSQIIWTSDAQGLNVEPQQGWSEFTGQSMKDVLGFGWLEAIHPEDRERVREAWLEAVKNKSFFFNNQRLRHQDGSYRSMEVRAAPVLNEDGSVREWIGTHTDVTERVTSEALLEKQTRILREQAELLSLANEAIIVSNHRGEIISWNKAATDLYGFQEEEVIGQTSHALFKTEYAGAKHIMEESLKKTGFWEGEVTHRRKDGETIVLLSRLAQRRDAQGKPREIVEVNWDITARKQVETEREKLLELTRRSEKEALALAEVASSFSLSKPLETNLSSIAERVVVTTGAVACGIEIYNSDNSTLYQSGSYGYSVEIGPALVQMRHNRIKTLTQEAIRERSVIIKQDYIKWALSDPARAPIHDLIRDLPWGTAVAMPLMSGKRPGAVIVFYPREADPDLTDLLQLSTIISQIALLVENIRLFEEAQGKAALEERQRLARDLHDSVSQSLYGISLGANSVKQALQLDINNEKLKRLAQTLDYLIHMSETAMAEMKSLIFELRPDSLEREGLVAALRKHLKALELRYRFNLELDLADEPDVPINVKEMLYRVAQEAMNNIVKHAKASKISLSLRIGDGVQLEVRDNGIGFDTLQDYPGHLGLRSMAERAEGLGATFSIQSSSQGTRVQVHIAHATHEHN